MDREGTTHRQEFFKSPTQENLGRRTIFQLPVCTGCSHAHVTTTLPLATGAIFPNAPSVVSRSSGWQPVHLSTTFRSRLRSWPYSASNRVALSIFPHNGLLLLFPPLLDVDPAASNKMCETATTLSFGPSVSPQAPRPGS